MPASETKPTKPAMTPQNRYRGNRAPMERSKITAQVVVRESEGGVAVIRLYDAIDSWGGWWGISAKEFAQAVDDLADDVTEIRVLINSPGGEAYQGIAITNILRNHPARVVAVVEGLAASAASVVAMAADEVVMAPQSQMMIHDASAIAWGDARAMAHEAKVLDGLSQNIASAYADRAGTGTVDDWRATMLAETWYSAQEAVDAGLADRVGTVAAIATSSEGVVDDDAGLEDLEPFDLASFAHFTYAGREHAPAPKLPAASASGSTPPAAPAPGDSTQEGSPVVTFTDEQLATLRQEVGVSADADGATLLAAVQEALNERADSSQGTTPTNQTPGTVVLDAETVAQLRADAAAGQEARTQQLEERRVAAVTAAVNDGRIPPARKDHWLAQLQADPGAENVLASLAAGTVPVSPVGHADDAESTSDTPTLETVRGSEAYKNWSV